MSSTPKLRVHSVRQVFNDGNHNAFTDLCRFKDRLYLTFRSCPGGHGVVATSKIVVLTSADDGQTWDPVFEFSVPDRDVRDPHFLEFRDTLFVYTGTWLCDPADPGKRDLNDHLGHGAWSTDGTTWEGPQFLEGTYGHYIWQAATCAGKAYLCGRRRREFAHSIAAESREGSIQAAMLESDDGLVWKTAGLFSETCGNETAFLFEDDGSVLAMVRSAGSQGTRVCRSKPPYQEWNRTDLGVYVGGPLLTKWGEHYLVGGRKMTDGRGAKTVLYWLVGDTLEEIAELPSGGDNSYPGFVPMSETRGQLSYYSSHEGSGSHLAPAAIYLADIERTSDG